MVVSLAPESDAVAALDKVFAFTSMLLIMTNAAHQAWREQSNHTFTFCYFGWTTFIIKDVRSGCFALSGRMLAP
jgi:hypothetical protein